MDLLDVQVLSLHPKSIVVGYGSLGVDARKFSAALKDHKARVVLDPSDGMKALVSSAASRRVFDGITRRRWT